MSDYAVMEDEARRLTWHAWIDRDVGRLFPLPEIVAVRQRIVVPRWWGERNARVWREMDEQYHGRAVGVVVPIETVIERYALDACAVGVWTGIRRGFLGSSDLHLTNFSGPGSTLHRSPFNIGFVHILPEPFQRHADAMWDSDDEEDMLYRRCYCSYRYKDEEQPCDCHLSCAGCCQGERARDAIRQEAA